MPSPRRARPEFEALLARLDAALNRTGPPDPTLYNDVAATIHALVTALRQIEAHHVQSNLRKGRDESRSETLRLVRQVLDG